MLNEPKTVLRGFRPMTKHKLGRMAARIGRYKHALIMRAFRQEIAADVRDNQMAQLAIDGGFEAHPLGYKDLRP